MIKNFEQLKEMLKAMPVKRKVAVVPAQDEHTLEAISHAYRDGMVEPVLIGDEPKIREILAQIGTDADKMTIIHVEDPTEAIQKAADMARDGEVDCIMKGKTETGALMKVLVNRERGIRKNDTMSLLAFMESPNYHKVFAITDVGLLTYPSKDQKKAAIQNAVEAFHALGVEQPKVAILAAVEKVNPKMKETVEAAEIKEEGVDGCIIEGTVENSVLARGVRIAPGAHVKNCIIMQDGQVHNDASIENCILDKQTVIKRSARLIGPAAYPIVIAKNVVI